MVVQAVHMRIVDHASCPFLTYVLKRICPLHEYGACVAEVVRGLE